MSGSTAKLRKMLKVLSFSPKLSLTRQATSKVGTLLASKNLMEMQKGVRMLCFESQPAMNTQ